MKLRGPDPRQCEEVRDLMSDHVDGELDPEEHKRVDDHVSFCPRCRQVLTNLQHTLQRLGLLSDVEPPGADDPDAVAERVRRAWRERV